ncbi:MAG: hypothetical protein CVV27_03420 [Candidatus Melainabacteria bacterium HGW-Melainabacteria-1]|nr:MAG: hypothetical protein CVV27_03420 [Candidatus Melainabacteria bacterium HGW-Melainabacteria-1]
MTADFSHSLLRRQLRKHLPGGEISSQSQPLLAAVNQAYHDADTDRLMLERSLELASQELLQRNSELRQLLDANPDLCLRLDHQGRILDWYGQAGSRDFWTQLAMQQSFTAGLPVDTAQKLLLVQAQVLAGQHPEHTDIEVQLSEGPARLELRFVPLFGNQCLVMIRNTTERHRWEGQLAQRNRQLLSFHMMAEVIMTSGSLAEGYERIARELWDLTGFEDIAIESYDAERACMIVQASTQHGRQLPFEVPLDQTLSGLVARSGQVLIERDALSRPEYAHPLLRSLQIQTFVCIPLKSEQRVIGALCLGSAQIREVDEAFVQWMTSLARYLALLTQRKQVEIELLQSKREAEAANQAKNRFLATMSHELRTPLNAVLGFARVLLKDASARGKREQSFLERIYSNGRHLLELINEVLDISRIETGQQELNIVSLELPALLLEVIGECEHLFQRQRLLWCLDIPGELRPIQSDAVRMRQILTNLLNNAIKFTPEGGAVKFRVLAQAGQVRAIEVIDSGIGIAPELQEQIFEAFFQVESAYDRRFEGTGLGLAIVRSLAHALGCRIEVESQPGQGSLFRVCLST